MTYLERLNAVPTLDELLRPVSAKVMPRTAMLSLHGTLTEGQAIAKQRRTYRTGGKRPTPQAKGTT